MIRNWKAVFLYLVFSVNGFAQTLTVENTEIWNQLYISNSFKDKLSLESDLGFRFKSENLDFRVFLIRSSFGITINKKIKLLNGFGYFNSVSSENLITNEFRPYHELRITNKKLIQRIRLEERFFLFDQNNNHSALFEFRFRYQIMYNFLQKESSKFFLSTGIESLFGFRKYEYNTKIRLQINPTFKIREKLTLITGFMPEFSFNSNSDIRKLKNVFWLKLFYAI